MSTGVNDLEEIPKIDIDEYNVSVFNRLNINRDIYHGNHKLENIMNYVDYKSIKNCKKNDVVFYEGSSYICIKDTDNNEAPDDSAHWKEFPIGPTGQKGDKGEIGPIGHTGPKGLNENIYNMNGSLISNRILNLNGYNMSLSKVPQSLFAPSILALDGSNNIVRRNLFSLYNLGKSITVAQNGGDFNNIQDAIEEARNFKHTFDNKLEIIIYEGKYLLSDPQVIPAFTTLRSYEDKNISKVSISSDKDIKMFTLSEESTISGITLIGNGSGRGICVDGKNKCAISNVILSDFSHGFVINNGALSFIEHCTIKNVNSGLNVWNGSICNVNGIKFVDNTKISVYLTDDSIMKANNLTVINCPTHVYAKDKSLIYLSGCAIRADLIKIDNDAKIIGTYFSDKIGDTSQHVNCELVVGNAKNPSKFVTGGGSCHTEGMVVFRGIATSKVDNGSSFIDITSNIINLGSPTNIFNTGSINDTIFIGCVRDVFPGIKVIVGSPILPNGGINSSNNRLFIVEYYNGSNWAQSTVMSTSNNQEHLPFADNIFQAGSYHFRFGYNPEKMALLNLNSVEAYYIRIRLVSNLSSNGTIDQIKLHPIGRTEIHDDGFVEYFSRYMTNSISLNINLFTDSNNTDIGMREHVFVSSETHRSSFSFILPTNVDTSKGLILSIRYVASSTSNTGGNVTMEISAAYVTDVKDNSGSLSDIYTIESNSPSSAPGLLINTKNNLTIPSGGDNKLRTQQLVVPISKVVTRRIYGSFNGDMIIINITRLGTEAIDTYAGNISIRNIRYEYVKWF